jgi:plasmid stabilization system protein ParE
VKRTLRIDVRASAELAEAVRWYESKHRGLGAEFLNEVAQTVERVATTPDAGSPLSEDHKTRRLLVPRFPYQLVYRVRETELVIIAFAHVKRRPGYWNDRASG